RTDGTQFPDYKPNRCCGTSYNRDAWVCADYTNFASNKTLTIDSSNPNSGVGITVSPTDLNGQNNGTTSFTRLYSTNTNVTLTAPSSGGGNTFQKWQRDGADWDTNLTTSLSMDVNHTMTAVFVTSSCTYSDGSLSNGTSVNDSITCAVSQAGWKYYSF